MFGKLYYKEIRSFQLRFYAYSKCGLNSILLPLEVTWHIREPFEIGDFLIYLMDLDREPLEEEQLSTIHLAYLLDVLVPFFLLNM